MLSRSLRDALVEMDPAGGGGFGVEPWPTLLIVDSDPEMLRTLVCFFEKRAFHVAPAASLSEAKTLFRRRRSWSLVIADYHLPDGYWLHEQPGAAPPVLLMSGNPHGAALCMGIDFLAKPFRVEALEKRVRLLLDRARN
jgi:DNA-binding response OmpR family regulator